MTPMSFVIRQGDQAFIVYQASRLKRKLPNTYLPKYGKIRRKVLFWVLEITDLIQLFTPTKHKQKTREVLNISQQFNFPF